MKNVTIDYFYHKVVYLIYITLYYIIFKFMKEGDYMREKYNSFEYWKNIIVENRTIRGHIFMNELPTEKSVYMHTLIYSRGNGLNNIWSYFPNIKAFIGYVQYSFLQEAFYIWINCKDESIAYIPLISVEEVIRDGEASKKITKAEADKMRKDINKVKRCWDLPSNKALIEMKKFIREFNRNWYGDSKEFLYMKLFDKPEDLGKFVLESKYMASSEEEFKSKTNEDLTTWIDLCRRSTKDKEAGEIFKKILQKSLTEAI